jgi:hypothetical protein
MLNHPTSISEKKANINSFLTGKSIADIYRIDIFQDGFTPGVFKKVDSSFPALLSTSFNIMNCEKQRGPKMAQHSEKKLIYLKGNNINKPLESRVIEVASPQANTSIIYRKG